MTNSIYLLTSFTERSLLLETMSSLNPVIDNSIIEFPTLNAKISDGDDYFLKQREGMLNFFSGLVNPNHMDVHSKFLMHLATCVKGYKLEYESDEVILPLINAFIENMHGLIFTPTMAFYTANWQLIINSEGACELTDYDVKMSAATFDKDIVTDTESEDRKQRTITLLKEKNIPTLETLPVVPSSSQIKYRTDTEIATRIIALATVAVKGELKKSDVSFNILQKYNIQPEQVSPWELHFLKHPEPEEQNFINAIWRYESLYVLMWAAGYIDNLHFPSQIVDVSALVTPIRDSKDFEDFLSRFTLRPINEILDELDLCYRLHWACVNAQVKNEPLPDNLDRSIIYERHYALNWLIDRYGEDWDDVSTST